MNKICLFIFVLFLNASGLQAEKGDPQLTLIKVEATPESIVRAWPKNSQYPLELSTLKSLDEKVQDIRSVALVAVLPANETEDFISAFSHEAKTLKLPDGNVGIKVTREKDTPEYLHLIVTIDGHSIEGFFWENHQTPIFVTPNTESPGKSCFYVLRLK